jgi:hypothetical protein
LISGSARTVEASQSHRASFNESNLYWIIDFVKPKQAEESDAQKLIQPFARMIPEMEPSF